MAKKYDLIVIGAGPAGYVGAIRAAQLGLKVAIVEKDARLGGTCLNRGCIPTKALLHYSHAVKLIEQASDFGVTCEKVEVDVAKMDQKKNGVIQRMAQGISGLMRRNKIEVLQGAGKVLGSGKVEVKGETYHCEHILLATGSRPSRPRFLNVDGERVVTSDEVLKEFEVPESIAVLGAGAVGVEFANIFHDLGSKVTLIEMAKEVLPLEEPEVGAELRKSFTRRGIEVKVATKVVDVSSQKEHVVLTAKGPKGEESWNFEKVLCALGREPVLEEVGAKELGLIEDRFVKVNDYYQTSLPKVYAVGDIIATMQLAHVASAEAIVAVEHMAGHPTHKLDYGKIPSATYCSPEVASVGMGEKEAKEKGYDVIIGRFPWSALGKAQVVGETEGFVKIVGDKEYQEVLGVHIIGPSATDLIAEGTLALSLEATAEELVRTVHAHPTLSEAVAEAAHGLMGHPLHLPPVKK